MTVGLDPEAVGGRPLTLLREPLMHWVAASTYFSPPLHVLQPPSTYFADHRFRSSGRCSRFEHGLCDAQLPRPSCPEELALALEAENGGEGLLNSDGGEETEGRLLRGVVDPRSARLGQFRIEARISKRNTNFFFQFVQM